MNFHTFCSFQATGSLIGEDAAISTSKELEGGVMYAPMMGDIIATYHTTPQVRYAHVPCGRVASLNWFA